MQLLPFHYKTTDDPLSLTKLWQGQLDVLKLVSDTAIVPTLDLGDINDVHPGKKDEVGKRLSLIALHQTYGRTELTSCCPIYDSYAVEAEQIRVRFRDVGSGLVSRDGQPLTWFQLAGDGRTFVDATAEIANNDTVVVKCLRCQNQSRFALVGTTSPSPTLQIEKAFRHCRSARFRGNPGADCPVVTLAEFDW